MKADPGEATEACRTKASLDLSPACLYLSPAVLLRRIFRLSWCEHAPANPMEITVLGAHSHTPCSDREAESGLDLRFGKKLCDLG